MRPCKRVYAGKREKNVRIRDTIPSSVHLVRRQKKKQNLLRTVRPETFGKIRLELRGNARGARRTTRTSKRTREIIEYSGGQMNRTDLSLNIQRSAATIKVIPDSVEASYLGDLHRQDHRFGVALIAR